MNRVINLEALKFEPLTTENLKAVYEMCEANVLFVSRPFKTFKRHTFESDLFEPDLSIVAKNENGNIAAFFMAVIRRSNVLKKKRKVAVLKFFVVEKKWRNIGLGTKLFNLIHKKIKNSEQKCWRMAFQVHQSQPDYWSPGLDPRHTEAYFFLKKLGFKKGHERNNLWIDLEDIKQPPSDFKGYKISRATLEDKEELVPLKFMPKTYRLGFWPEETKLSFKNEPITSFVARDANNRIIGWASHSMLFPGNFGPTGVKVSERGKGLGSVLLEWCLWDMKQIDLNRATIMWVVGNTVYFYLKSKGAHICEFYWTMKRKV